MFHIGIVFEGYVSTLCGQRIVNDEDAAFVAMRAREFASCPECIEEARAYEEDMAVRESAHA